jgi:hypothetical protein
MKIRCKRDIAIKGQHHEAGSVVDVDNQTGISLVNMDRAELAEENAELDNRAVGLTTENAAPLTKRKKAK